MWPHLQRVGTEDSGGGALSGQEMIYLCIQERIQLGLDSIIQHN